MNCYIDNDTLLNSYATLNQKYTSSCSQTWRDYITGASHYDSEYNAVSYDPDQEVIGLEEEVSSVLSNYAAFTLFRSEPKEFADVECVSRSRNAITIGLNIFAFVGSMVGLHAFFRTALTWSEPIKEKLQKLCV